DATHSTAETPASSPGKRMPRKKTTRKAPEKVPSILLEGDQPSTIPLSGPGRRYALGSQPPSEPTPAQGGLPEAYGTRQLLLAARDPHWLYAHWDLSLDQQRQYNALSGERHLVLRIHLNSVSDLPVEEVAVHPESRHWFVHVGHSGTRYVAELGYYPPNRKWTTISTSGPALTPPETISTDTTA